jgi:NADPH2:quinone reductase
VLIHGASGGVGTAAAQFARAFGLTVFGTAGTQKGLDLARKEGAHHVFDHSKPGYSDEIMKATGGRGVDVILEMLANVNLSTDLKTLAMNGRVIIIGNRGEITINPRDLMPRRGTARGFTLWAATETEQVEMHAAIAAGLENGTLRPIVGKELPLKEAAQAHVDVLAPGAHGKIVLVP